MKRLVSIMICAVLALSMAAVCAISTAGADYVRGDANGDGKIDMLDLFSLKMHLSEYRTFVDFDCADANGDGQIDLVDMLELKKALSGHYDSLNSLYPPEDSDVGKITVAGKDIGSFAIVVSDPENANMCFAAEELQKYVAIAARRTLQIFYGSTDARNVILLTADPGSVMGNDGYSITVNDKGLILCGGAKRGLMYAVYGLLEDYVGFRFTGYRDRYLYKAASVDIPDGTVDVQIPKVLYRCLCTDPYKDQYLCDSVITNKLSGSTDQPSMLQAKYGYGIQRLLCNAHSFDYFIPPEDNDGVSVPCLQAEETYDICLANMEKLIDSRLSMGQTVGNEITEISCSYDATGKFCQCRDCRILFREEQSHAGALVQFVNMIDDALTEKYPGIRVITNAYSEVRKPPKNVVLNDDVVLLYCWNGCANHKIGTGECGSNHNCLGYSNTVEESYYLGWAEHCSQIYVWYYPTNIYYLLCPQPNLDNLWNDFRWFVDHKAVGFYVVGTTGSSFEDLDSYLIAKLMWDSDMTRDEYDSCLREYLEIYYGDGWTYIAEYIKISTEAGDLKGCVLNDFEQPFDIYSKDYFIEHFDEMEELFRKAAAAAGTIDQKEAVKRLSVHMYFLGYSALYEDRYVNGTQGQRSAYAEGWRSLYEYINANGIRTTYDTRGISRDFTLDVSPMQLVYNIDGER